jgi:hypothetical protein
MEGKLQTIAAKQLATTKMHDGHFPEGASMLLASVTPTTGNTFTIVSATSVTHTFAGLANNSVVTFNGRNLRVNYSASAVTLTDVTRILTSAQVRLLYPWSFVRQSNGFVQATFTLVNLTNTTLLGPIKLFFPKLPAGVTVVTSTSLASLGAKQSGRISVVFKNPSNAYLGSLPFLFPALVTQG